ncbi:MAG: hypothetical protein NT047_00675 [Deltaproteobacteria bacterium]|nr:hypothetical protein [Deltaproteobacteria bacterium]
MINSDFSERLDVFLRNRILTIKDLAGELSVSDALINDMKNKRLKGPGIKFWRGFRSKYPEWESYLRGEVPDPPIAQQTDIALRDVAAAHFMSDWSPEIQAACWTVKKILESKDKDAASALKQNIHAFEESVNRWNTNADLQKQFEDLKQQFEEFKRINDIKLSTGTD